MGFADQLKKFSEKTTKRAEGVLDEVSAELQNRFEDRTPVDTGFARSRWDRRAEGPHRRVIFNDCEYIEALEDGHSKQAPHGMVKTTLPEFPAIVDQAVKKVKNQ